MIYLLRVNLDECWLTGSSVMDLFRFPVHDVFNGFVKVHGCSEVEEPARKVLNSGGRWQYP